MVGTVFTLNNHPPKPLIILVLKFEQVFLFYLLMCLMLLDECQSVHIQLTRRVLLRLIGVSTFTSGLSVRILRVYAVGRRAGWPDPGRQVGRQLGRFGVYRPSQHY